MSTLFSYVYAYSLYCSIFLGSCLCSLAYPATVAGGYVVLMVLVLGGSSPSQAQTGTTVAGGNRPGSAANQLADPRGVFMDGAGNVFVTDQRNHRIQRFGPNTAPIATANRNQTATVGIAFADTVNAFADSETSNDLTYQASQRL